MFFLESQTWKLVAQKITTTTMMQWFNENYELSHEDNWKRQNESEWKHNNSQQPETSHVDNVDVFRKILNASTFVHKRPHLSTCAFKKAIKTQQNTTKHNNSCWRMMTRPSKRQHGVNIQTQQLATTREIPLLTLRRAEGWSQRNTGNSQQFTTIQYLISNIQKTQHKSLT